MIFKFKLFDSLAHPTLSGKWDTLSKKKINVNCSFKDLHNSMRKYGIYKALAIGMSNFEGYDHFKFIKECKKYKNLKPVAGINPQKSFETLKKEISLVKKLGFKAVKIHPRISNFDLKNKKFIKLLKLLEDKNMIVMVCTFPQLKLGKKISYNFFDTLVDSLNQTKNLKVILVHGGCTDLLKYSEFAKINNNRILLDLSLTIMRYSGSSIDKDIKYLFKNLDKIVCIGSDYPEVNYGKLKKRLKFFSKNMPKNKLENIYFKNLEFFLN